MIGHLKCKIQNKTINVSGKIIKWKEQGWDDVEKKYNYILKC